MTLGVCSLIWQGLVRCREEDGAGEKGVLAVYRDLLECPGGVQGAVVAALRAPAELISQPWQSKYLREAGEGAKAPSKVAAAAFAASLHHYATGAQDAPPTGANAKPRLKPGPKAGAKASAKAGAAAPSPRASAEKGASGEGARDAATHKKDRAQQQDPPGGHMADPAASERAAARRSGAADAGGAHGKALAGPICPQAAAEIEERMRKPRNP